MSISSKKSVLGLLAATALFTSACGDKAKEVAQEIDKQANGLQANDQWKSTCKNSLWDIVGISSMIEDIDIGASLTKETTLFNEDNCQTALVKISEHGSYKIGDKVAGEAYNFDVTYENVKITALNDQGRKKLEDLKICGISNWPVGQPQDVTASTSDNKLELCWAKTPRQNYDLIEITGDKLKFGLTDEGKDKKTPETRPVYIDQEVTYTRH